MQKSEVLWCQVGQEYKQDICRPYIDAVIHESLSEIVNNFIFIDLLQEDHILNTTLLDIVTLPVVRLKKHKQ